MMSRYPAEPQQLDQSPVHVPLCLRWLWGGIEKGSGVRARRSMSIYKDRDKGGHHVLLSIEKGSGVKARVL